MVSGGIIRCLALSILPSLLMVPCGLTAQGVLDLGRFSECRKCTTNSVHLARLGQPDGPGIIEGNVAEVRYDPMAKVYAVFQIGGTSVKLFRPDGSFLRTIGRVGGGPGELRSLIDVQFYGDSIAAVDQARAKLLWYDHDGVFQRELQLSGLPGRIQLVSDSQLVVAAMDRSPDVVGYPLHLVTANDLTPVRHFGSSSGHYNSTRPYASKVLLGRSADRRQLWIGNPAELRFVRWTVSGARAAEISGSTDWFRRALYPDRDAAPPPNVADFGVDTAGMLWVVTQVPDPQWKQVRRHGAEGFVLLDDLDGYFDSRVDIYDLKRRMHVGSLRFSNAFVGLVSIGSALGIQRVVEDKVGNPFIEVSKVVLAGGA